MIFICSLQSKEHDNTVSNNGTTDLNYSLSPFN